MRCLSALLLIPILAIGPTASLQAHADFFAAIQPEGSGGPAEQALDAHHPAGPAALDSADECPLPLFHRSGSEPAPASGRFDAAHALTTSAAHLCPRTADGHGRPATLSGRVPPTGRPCFHLLI